MTRILTVEDDPIIQADISQVIERAGYECCQASTAESALQLIRKQTVHLFLLDINLGKGADGITLAVEIRKILPLVPIIFITSYYDPQTLAQVQPVMPEAFILKPFEERTLMVNVNLALYKSNSKGAVHSIADSFSSQIFVRNKQELVSIDPGNILYLEADDNYAFVHTEDTKYYLTHTIKSMEGKLTSLGFFRIHKSYIVSLRKITSIQEGYLFIKDIKLPIGRKFKQEFIRALTIL
mgnify:CR=1 FL=1